MSLSLVEKMLERLADIQSRHYKIMFLITLIVTIILASGLTKLEIQTDINKEMPQNLSVFKLGNKISDTFGGQDIILVLVRLDPDSNIQSAPKDIRDPKVIQSLVDLEDLLADESSIDRIQSIGTIFNTMDGVPSTLDDVRANLSDIPDSAMFFNKDYTATLLYAYTSVGTSEEKTRAVTDSINNYIEQVSKPPGIKLSVTGILPMRIVILDLLVHDASFTIIVAALIILGLLIIMQGSISKAILVFIPLSMGLIWTIGAMGWLNIPLSIATVGLGAMILGLGVEYGVFIVARYDEERDKGITQRESLIATVPSVGYAIFGSATTTMAGFLALLASAMPMMQHLGLSLALGIFFSMTAAVVANPPLILIGEKLSYNRTHKKHRKYTQKLEKHKERKWR
ncbi:MAG: hypothetical protein DRN71_00975 [Candidatus Nanohalarchaeota archaeon]|nr:MAG: hypothetical protein DRN71_00975 [Candidatus Nanohaloarchaeota archaeon]